MATSRKKRAVIYARYSSEMQDVKSCDGQIRLCREIAKRNNFEVVGVYQDNAKSGQSIAGRDGYAALCQGARQREFDIIIAEHTDRLSRDKVDLPQLQKLLEFNDIQIQDQHRVLTATDIQVQALVNSLDKGNRADKVRRGHDLAVYAGKFPGAVTYGYSAVKHEPGARVINPNEAKILRRIFAEYAQGRSPRDIALDLTRDGIPTPGSTRKKKHKDLSIWNSQAFVGGRHKAGMISNRIYIGELIWNTHHSAENPDTRKPVKIPNDPSKHIAVSVPHLRIIDQQLWDAVQKVRKSRSVQKFGPSGKVQRRPVVARNGHVLSGLLICGECGGHMRIAQVSRNGTSRAACAAAHQHGTCSHTKSYDFDFLRDGVRDRMPEFLLNPAALEAAMDAYREEKKKGKQNDSERMALERRRNALTLQIENLVEIASNTRQIKEVAAKIDEKEAERSAIEERLAQLGTLSNVVELHPRFMDKYHAAVLSVHKAMIERPDALETRIAFRSLIERIVVHPTAKRAPYEFTPYARVAALEGINASPKWRSTKEIFAAQGYPCTDNANTGKSGLAQSQQQKGVISLGRWRQVA